MPEEFVFDTCQRTDVGRKLRSESVFEYLNRSAEVPAGRVRDLIEAWYTAFPQDGKTDIRGRLRSGLDGSLRPVPGILPLVAAAAEAGVVVPPSCSREACLVPRAQVRTAPTL